MLLHWIWFAELKNVTLLQKHRLLERFGDPEELYHTSTEALQDRGVREALQDKDLKPAEEILRVCNHKIGRASCRERV